MYRSATFKLYREKGNSLKSLSCEVVTSAALFTRLMPRCTQEQVNQARGYTRRPEPASSSSRSFHSQSPSEPERGYAMQWRPSQRWRPAVYSIHWYTIHNSSTDDRGLGRAKTFRASMRSAAAVCRELCVAKRRIIWKSWIIILWHEQNGPKQSTALISPAHSSLTLTVAQCNS